MFLIYPTEKLSAKSKYTFRAVERMEAGTSISFILNIASSYMKLHYTDYLII